MYWVTYKNELHQALVYLKHDDYYRAYIAEAGGDVTLQKWQILGPVRD
jgi:hypothetical protein